MTDVNVPKLQDPKSLLVVSSKGQMRQLFVPFRVECIHPVEHIRLNTHVFVEGVFLHRKYILIYFINQRLYPYFHFRIPLNYSKLPLFIGEWASFSIMEAIIPAVAEVTVTYINKQTAKERKQISSSTDAYDYLLKGFNPDTIAYQEQFVALYLNRGNQVLGLYRVSTGGITGVVADPRMILATALKIAAVSVLVAHNHPSGTLRPSRQDEELTIKLKEGGKFLDIKLLDHLIVSPCGSAFFSFADEGLL
jgi:DNA repair protein RadC